MISSYHVCVTLLIYTGLELRKETQENRLMRRDILANECDENITRRDIFIVATTNNMLLIQQ